MMDFKGGRQLLEKLINEERGYTVGQDEFAEIQSIGADDIEIYLKALARQLGERG